MKLQIDTAAKTIKVEHIVNLGELMKALADMFPDGAWKEYSIDPVVIQNWNNPIYIDPNPVQPYQWPWQQQPTRITFGTGSGPIVGELASTVFNVDYNLKNSSDVDL